MDEGVSVDEASLFLKWLCGGGLGGGGNFFTGDPGRYVEKVSEYGRFCGGPFPVEGNLVRGEGLYTRDFDSQTMEGCSGGASLCEGFH